MWTLFQHEVKYYFKNIDEVIYITGFFSLMVLAVPLGLQQSQLGALAALAPAILWMAMVASIGLGALPLFQRDAEQGVIEVYQQLPRSLYNVVLAKWLAFYLVTLVPMLLILPIFIGLMDIAGASVWHYAAGVTAGVGALSIIATLAAAMTIGLARARAISMLIALPLATPVIIFGSEYLRRSGELGEPQLLFLVAFSIFLLPIMVLASAACIRASN